MKADDGRRWIVRAERHVRVGDDLEFRIGPGTYAGLKNGPMVLTEETWIARFPAEEIASVSDITETPLETYESR